MRLEFWQRKILSMLIWIDYWVEIWSYSLRPLLVSGLLPKVWRISFSGKGISPINFRIWFETRSIRLDFPKRIFFIPLTWLEDLETLSRVAVLWAPRGTPILDNDFMLWDWNLPLPSIISSLAEFIVEESVKARLSRKCAASAQPVLPHLRETISSHFDRLMFFWSLVGQRNAGNDGVRGVRSFRTTCRRANSNVTASKLKPTLLLNIHRI